MGRSDRLRQGYGGPPKLYAKAEDRPRPSKCNHENTKIPKNAKKALYKELFFVIFVGFRAFAVIFRLFGGGRLQTVPGRLRPASADESTRRPPGETRASPIPRDAPTASPDRAEAAVPCTARTGRNAARQ